ncbi:hypothetical protein QFC21_006989 [Naganishia friedmannii]|uniref:Uncharacterized protein n=1 Tax=Naganishia friedmannii TaxID=89922 RepID=A0ACC2UZ50_9TREE|nr:hypothetical protein QFC21_006989 [Naganishia friedmannii]
MNVHRSLLRLLTKTRPSAVSGIRHSSTAAGAGAVEGPSFLQQLANAPPSALGALHLPPSGLIPRSRTVSKQEIPAPHAPQHRHINHPDRLFTTPRASEMPEVVEQNSQQVKEKVLKGLTGLDTDELRGLTRYTVVLKRVVNMTKKGKIQEQGSSKREEPFRFPSTRATGEKGVPRREKDDNDDTFEERVNA